MLLKYNRYHQLRDPVLKTISTYVSNGWPTDVTDDLKPYKARQNEIGLEDKCLMWGVCVIIPQFHNLFNQCSFHENHPGITRMKAIARSYAGGVGLIDKAIEEVAKSNPPWVWLTIPWKRIHIDFAGPFLNKMFLSKWPEVILYYKN